MRKNIAAIRAAGGIAQVNHPNYRWSVRLTDLLALPDSTLFEIANAHTLVNNPGALGVDGRDVPSTEALWDSLLSRGKVLFAVGDDDAHSFKPQDADDVRADAAGPVVDHGARRHAHSSGDPRQHSAWRLLCVDRRDAGRAIDERAANSSVDESSGN